MTEYPLVVPTNRAQSNTFTPAENPLVFLEQPLIAESYKSWQNIDGAGQLLVQKRNARGLAKRVRNNVDRWHFRILHVADKNGNEEMNRKLQFHELSHTCQGHEHHEPMNNAHRHILAMATSEADIRLVWQDLRAVVGVQLSLSIWRAAAQHLSEGFLPPRHGLPSRSSPETDAAALRPSVAASDPRGSVVTPSFVSNAAQSRQESLWSRFGHSPGLPSRYPSSDVLPMAAPRLRRVQSSSLSLFESAPMESRGVAAVESDGRRAHCASVDVTSVVVDQAVAVVHGRMRLAKPVRSSVQPQRPIAPGSSDVVFTASGSRAWVDPDMNVFVDLRRDTRGKKFKSPFEEFIEVKKWSLRDAVRPSGFDLIVDRTRARRPVACGVDGATGTVRLFVVAEVREWQNPNAPTRQCIACLHCDTTRSSSGAVVGPFFACNTTVVRDLVASPAGSVLVALSEVDVGGSSRYQLSVFRPASDERTPLRNVLLPEALNPHSHSRMLLRVSPDCTLAVCASVGDQRIAMLALRPNRDRDDTVASDAGLIGTAPTLDARIPIEDVTIAADNANVIALAADGQLAYCDVHSGDTQLRSDTQLVNYAASAGSCMAVAISPEGHALYALLPSSTGRITLVAYDAARNTVRWAETGIRLIGVPQPKLTVAGVRCAVQCATQFERFDLFASSASAVQFIQYPGRPMAASHVALSANGSLLAVVDASVSRSVELFHLDSFGPQRIAESEKGWATPPGIVSITVAPDSTTVRVRGKLQRGREVQLLLADRAHQHELYLDAENDRGDAAPVPPLRFPIFDVRKLAADASRPIPHATLLTGFVDGHRCVISAFDPCVKDVFIRADLDLAGRVSYPNVVEYLGPVYDVPTRDDVDRKRVGLAYELMDCTLRQALVARKPQLSIADVFLIGLQIAQALADLHEHEAATGEHSARYVGRGHGDVNLDNILIRCGAPEGVGYSGAVASLGQQLRRSRPAHPTTATEALATAAADNDGAATAVTCDTAASSTVLSESPAGDPSGAPTPMVASSTVVAHGYPAPPPAITAKLTNVTWPLDLKHLPEDLGQPQQGSFCAPERGVSDPPTAAADVYSLGVVLFAALHAVDNPDAFGLRDTDPSWLSDRVAGDTNQRFSVSSKVPVSAMEIVEACMKTAPQDRPRADTLVVDLQCAVWVLSDPECLATELLSSPPRFTLPSPPRPLRAPSRIVPPLLRLPRDVWTSLNHEFKSETEGVDMTAGTKSTGDPLFDRLVVPSILGAPSARYAYRHDFSKWGLRLIHCLRSAAEFECHLRHEAVSLQMNPKLRVNARPTNAQCEVLNGLERRVVRSDGDSQPPPRFVYGPDECPQPQVVLAWAAVRADAVGAICRDGMRKFESVKRKVRDDGYFGCDVIYFALEAAIAAEYMHSSSDPAEPWCLMLFAVAVAQPLAVTLQDHYTFEGDGFSCYRGRPIGGTGHDAVFVPVRNYGNAHPLAPLSVKLPHSCDFQAAIPGDTGAHQPDGHELAVLDRRQCTPLLALYPPGAAL